MLTWWYFAVPVLLWAVIVGSIVAMINYPGSTVRILCGGGMLVCIRGFWLGGADGSFDATVRVVASVGAAYLGVSILLGGL